MSKYLCVCVFDPRDKAYAHIVYADHPLNHLRMEEVKHKLGHITFHPPQEIDTQEIHGTYQFVCPQCGVSDTAKEMRKEN